MKIQVISKIENGVETPINAKGCEDIEFDMMNELAHFNNDRKNRYIGIGRKRATMYKMTLASWKELKAELLKRGSIWRFDYSKR